MASKRTVAAVAGALFALVLASCSSEDDGGDGDKGASSVRGVTADTIKIGGVASLTNAQGPVFPGAELGAKARFEAANKAGGINGRKIEYVEVLDDATTPAKNTDAIRKLVLDEKVFAIAPVMSIVFQPQVSDFLAKEKVPFTGWGVQPGFCKNDWGFGFNGCLIGVDYDNVGVLGPTAELLEPGDTIAFIEGDSSAGRAAIRQIPAITEELGMKVVYLKPEIPDGAPVTDWTPYAKRLMTSDNGGPPDAIHADGLLPQAAGLSAALKQLGYKGPIINYSTYVPGLLETTPNVAQAVDGVYTNVQFGPQEQGGPAIDQMLKDLDAIGAKQLITLGVAASYWSADLMVKMLEATGEDLTPDNFAKKINGGFTYEPSVEGAMGPLEFPKGHEQPSPCAALVQADGTKYKAAVPFKCYTVLEAKK